MKFTKLPLKPCPLCHGKLEYTDESFKTVWCTARSCHYYFDMDSGGEEFDEEEGNG